MILTKYLFSAESISSLLSSTDVFIDAGYFLQWNLFLSISLYYDDA